MLRVWWPALFALATICLMVFIDVSPPEALFPPQLDLTGAQARRIFSSPWFLGVTIPAVAGLLWVRSFARSNDLKAEETRSMVWWMVNLFWFHLGCDVFSGLIQVQPVLTELYMFMTPSHRLPRWHEARSHLDAVYVLELIAEVPLAAWVLWSYARRDPARYTVEAFAAAVQLAGTVAYYAPGLAKNEVACWLSWADRTCGSVWIVFPIVLLRRCLAAARPSAGLSKGRKKA